MSSKTNQLKMLDILPTKLCTHKEDVETINAKELEKIQEESYKFKSIDQGDTRFLNKLCIAKQELNLKINSQVILLKNLDVQKKLVNGSRGCVIGFTEMRLPKVRFLDGSEIVIKYDTWSFQGGLSSMIHSRKQIPLDLAWAISIHKSQGMTLDSVEISLSRVFENGQAYVALSRAKSLQNVRILDFDINSIKADPIVLKYYSNLKKQQQIL
jgi:ATP-dependent DNA helicase PIF1